MLQRKKGVLLISFGTSYIRDSVRKPSLDRGGRKILMYYSPVCYCIIMVPQKWFHANAVQLACVRPAASVHPEPGSNSFLFVCPHVNVGLFSLFSCSLSTSRMSHLTCLSNCFIIINLLFLCFNQFSIGKDRLIWLTSALCNSVLCFG